jgi:N-acetylmuramic acid 6-phosphate etherase
MPLPKDRSHIETEFQNEHTMELDILETTSLVALLAKDHQQAIRAVEVVANEIADFIDSLAEQVRKGGRLIYLGCGTSGRLGVLDAAECPPTFQTDSNLVIGLIAGGDRSLKVSSEGEEDKPDGAKFALTELNLTKHDTVLGIAAGGTTPWVVGGIQIAKEMGANTAFLTCCSETPTCDHLITLNTGPEPLTGSTRMKAATATKLTLNIITTALFTRLGKVHGNLMVDLRASNTKLLDRAIRILCQACNLDRKEAHALLEQANGAVKVAIVMHRKQVNPKTAEQQLDAVGGNLRSAL